MSLQPLIDDALVVQQRLGAPLDSIPPPRHAAGEPPGSPGPELVEQPTTT